MLFRRDADGWPAEFHADSFRVFKKNAPPMSIISASGDQGLGPLDRRGQSFRLWNTDAFLFFKNRLTPIYKSIPFFHEPCVPGKSMGFLLDNNLVFQFSISAKRRAKTHIRLARKGGPPSTITFFYGPDPKQGRRKPTPGSRVVPPLPPMWSLGFQQSRFSYENRSPPLREIAGRLRADKISLRRALSRHRFPERATALSTVDSEHFPHFEQMLSDLKRQDFHVCRDHRPAHRTRSRRPVMRRTIQGSPLTVS